MKSYLFKTSLDDRPDVAGHFQNKNYRQTGFKAAIKLKDIPKGNYLLGIVLYSLKNKRYYLKESDNAHEVKIINT